MLDQQNFSQALISWFQAERSHIPVPARGSTNPYAIWVAETMLQQTQVSTVQPYFIKWLKTFPEIVDLAKAPLDQVLKLWEGMGYYSRARNLHKAAIVIIEKHDGQLPQSVESLIKIPGIGPYTAAAIASLAFGKAVPVIDGNVLRVLSRVERIEADITKGQTKKRIQEHLRTLIPIHMPGAFNQSLMDLGRAVCTPKGPKCNNCPISQVCLAYQTGKVENYPVKPKKPTVPHLHVVIGLLYRDGKVLIQKRPPKGLLGGLWEFPGGKIEPGESGEIALLREIKEETGLDVKLSKKIGVINHAYTHFKITLSAWFCDWVTGEAETHAATENRWIFLEETKKFAFPKANLKILDLLE